MDNTFDKMFYCEGKLIAGIDDVGVSDIAGPLVAACVVLPKIDLRNDDLRIFEVNDSKLIPEKYRKRYAEIIWQSAYAIGIGEVQAAEVDFLGKHVATTIAMLRAISACKAVKTSAPVRPDFLIVDGNRPVPTSIRQYPLINADEASMCVAAASIVAKVYRDDIMIKLHENYPYYNWASNKGYPCAEHFEGLDKHGAQIGIHRTNFWPFTPDVKKIEDAEWRKRRRGWRDLTAKNMTAELGGEPWISNPSLWKPSREFKASQRKGVKIGIALKASNELLSEKPTQENCS